MRSPRPIAVILRVLLVSVLPGSPVHGSADRPLNERLEEAIASVEAVRQQAGAVTVDREAARLGNGINDLFAFVRDGIRFEPYSGQQRGLAGTLQSAAGNSLEQALLLASLCRHKGLQCRVARGRLPEPAAADLLKTLFTGTVPPDATAGLEPGEVADPLGDPLLLAEPRDHFWIQSRDPSSGAWVDYDPSFANAESGKRYCEPTETFVQPPVRFSPRLAISLHLEGERDGKPVRPTPLRFEGRLAELVNAPLRVVLLTGRERAPEGPVLTGVKTFLVAGDDRVEGPSIGEVGDRSPLGGLLGSVAGSIDLVGEPAGGESPLTLARAWLEFDMTHADARRETWSHEIMDAAGAPASVAAVFTEIVMPGGNLAESQFAAEAAVFLEAWRRAVERAPPTGVVPPAGAESEAQLAELEEASDAAARALSALARFAAVTHAHSSDRKLQEMAEANGVAALHASPRMIIASVLAGEERFGLRLDLSRNRVRILAPPGAPLALQRRLHLARGLIEGGLESELVERWSGGENSGSIARLRVAEEQEIPVLVLRPGQEERLSQQGYSALAREKLREALREGHVLLVPARMFDVGGRQTLAWWQFDAVTGEPVAVSEDGTHQATWEDRILLWAVESAIGDAAVFFAGVIAGFHLGGSAVITAALECSTDPGCLGVAQVCSQAAVQANTMCGNWAYVADLLTKDFWSLLKGWQGASGGRGCDWGAQGALIVAGC